MEIMAFIGYLTCFAGAVVAIVSVILLVGKVNDTADTLDCEVKYRQELHQRVCDLESKVRHMEKP